MYAFHARVFGYPAPRSLFSTEQEPYGDAAYEQVSQAENEDLGYYADGVKRTLTNDQIAMFRHSEIYSILRARQVRKENLEAERGDESETMVLKQDEGVKAIVWSDEEGEVQSDGEAQEVPATLWENGPQDLNDMNAGKKRKRADADTSYAYGKRHASRSARGFVRELDSSVVEDQILDYGDEPSTIENSEQSGFADAQSAEHGPQCQTRPLEGKKIWWPIIEAR